MKVAVGISGGVDSAVAALLLKEQGHDLVGVTMALGRADEEKSVAEAQSVADHLGIPLKVFDFSSAWQTQVFEYIRRTYLDGATPNPCVRCNETVKFGLLPQAAFEMGCERFATGHYARVECGTVEQLNGGSVRLLRGLDHSKDQSYFLYRVKPEILARTIFPLGELTKGEVREIARRAGFAAAEREDSQDFCGGDPMEIVDTPDRPGDVVTVDGKVIGTHRGYWNYTVGMRKGLGIGGGTPYYVVALDAANNRVIVGFKEDAVCHAFSLTDLLMNDPAGPDAPPLRVKVRSAGEPRGPVTLAESTVRCPDGLTGVAPGQSAVFYRGDEIVGGGIIRSRSKSSLRIREGTRADSSCASCVVL